MRRGAEIYRAKAETCARQAALSNTADKDRWLKLADQWSKLADEVKKDRRRSTYALQLLSSRRRPSRASVPQVG
jgi:uncharacterized protein with NRDE domain